ncbi:hypothetical protein KQH65_04145 [archaeon]|nr:hypothetical protein [archaeon]
MYDVDFEKEVKCLIVDGLLKIVSLIIILFGGAFIFASILIFSGYVNINDTNLLVLLLGVIGLSFVFIGYDWYKKYK